MLKKCKFLDDKNVSYDFAYPVDWATYVYNKTGLWPHGVVWLYDKVAFGRPFPITMYAWWVCKLAGIEVKPLKERN